MIKNIKPRDSHSGGMSPEQSHQNVQNQDYSAYLENQFLSNQEEYHEFSNERKEIRIMSQKDKNKLKNQKPISINNLMEKRSRHDVDRDSRMSKEYRVSNSNSQMHNYPHEVKNSFEDTDSSQDLSPAHKQRLMMENRRRAHTEIENHSPSSRPYLSDPKTRFKHEGIKNHKQSKLSMKIKKRRKSEIEYDISDSFDQHAIDQDVQEAEKYINYPVDDIYALDPSTTPD